MTTHYLIQGDIFEILPKLKSEVDAVIVDPPYNTANKNTKQLKAKVLVCALGHMTVS